MNTWLSLRVITKTQKYCCIWISCYCLRITITQRKISMKTALHHIENLQNLQRHKQHEKKYDWLLIQNFIKQTQTSSHSIFDISIIVTPHFCFHGAAHWIFIWKCKQQKLRHEKVTVKHLNRWFNIENTLKTLWLWICSTDESVFLLL